MGSLTSSHQFKFKNGWNIAAKENFTEKVFAFARNTLAESISRGAGQELP